MHFILYIHASAEHTATDHVTDNAKLPIHEKQHLICSSVKTAQMNKESELIKDVQDSQTTRLICHERATILIVVYDGGS